MNSESFLIGSSLVWRGRYSENERYYKKHIVTYYTCLFVCKANDMIGVSPIVVGETGEISLANTEAWDCIIDNIELYNATLSTNNLASRISGIESNVEKAVNVANAANQSSQQAVNAFAKFKTVTESEYAALVESDSVDPDSYYFIVRDSE